MSSLLSIIRTAIFLLIYSTTKFCEPELITVIESGRELDDLGWTWSGGTNTFIDTAKQLPVFAPGDLTNLPGIGLWYAFKTDQEGTPSVILGTKKGTYQGATSLSLFIKYYAFFARGGSNEQAKVSPVSCHCSVGRAIRNCPYLEPRTWGSEWTNDTFVIDVDLLPIEITAELGNGDWLLFDKIVISLSEGSTIPRTTCASTTAQATTYISEETTHFQEISTEETTEVHETSGTGTTTTEELPTTPTSQSEQKTKPFYEQYWFITVFATLSLLLLLWFSCLFFLLSRRVRIRKGTLRTTETLDLRLSGIIETSVHTHSNTSA